MRTRLLRKLRKRYKAKVRIIALNLHYGAFVYIVKQLCHKWEDADYCTLFPDNRNGSFCNGCIKGERIESAKSHDTVESALRQANCIVEKKIYQYIREKRTESEIYRVNRLFKDGKERKST